MTQTTQPIPRRKGTLSNSSHGASQYLCKPKKAADTVVKTNMLSNQTEMAWVVGEGSVP